MDSNPITERNHGKGKDPAGESPPSTSKAIWNPNNVFGRQMRKKFMFDEFYINMNHGTNNCINTLANADSATCPTGLA